MVIVVGENERETKRQDRNEKRPLRTGIGMGQSKNERAQAKGKHVALIIIRMLLGIGMLNCIGNVRDR